MASKPKEHQVQVRIPGDLYDELQALSKAQERTLSQTIRFLLREALR